ncbi:hypothetical protein [Streptomyces albiflavescens]|nr:hypothetical protein [Streptomyces albiflavescens]
MKLVVQVKLLPTPVQAAALEATLHARRAAEKPVTFRPDGAQPYDDRMPSWQIVDRTVSRWTL